MGDGVNRAGDPWSSAGKNSSNGDRFLRVAPSTRPSGSVGARPKQACRYGRMNNNVVTKLEKGLPGHAKTIWPPGATPVQTGLPGRMAIL